ncbi:MAG: hypothetical protein H7321_05870 [Bacteroidia bacterium]|nr:hypothetical protein [Bacteroidia bacterium]
MRGKEFYHYVFPDFTEGTVKKKSGEIVKTLLNYNTITEEMIFQQAGTFRAFDNAERIDTVYIQNKKFVPAGMIFYEVATCTPVALFIRHQTEIVSPGNNTGFGTTQTAAISNLNSLHRSGDAYQLKLPDDFKLTSRTEYLLKKNGNYNYINVKNFKQVETVFSEKAALIKDYVKTNKLSFNKSEDVIKLILYCN